MKIQFEDHDGVEDILNRVISLNSYIGFWAAEISGGTGCGMNEKDIVGLFTYMEIQNAMMQAAIDISATERASTKPTVQAV